MLSKMNNKNNKSIRWISMVEKSFAHWKSGLHKINDVVYVCEKSQSVLLVKTRNLHIMIVYELSVTWKVIN